MPTAKESAKDKNKDIKDQKREEKRQAEKEAEAQEIEEVPEGDAPTPADEVGTGKADAQETVHDAVEEGYNEEGEEPASEPVTETASNEVSVDQADQHIYVDEITPGGTQLNNPTPTPKVVGDSYYGPGDPDEEDLIGQEPVKLSKSGAFSYEWDRNNPEFFIDRPKGSDISSAMAVVFAGDKEPEGTFGPYYSNKEDGILHTMPVDVTQHKLHVTLPQSLEELAGAEPARIAILDNKGERVAVSKPITFS
jgi:hypothetical protein